MKAVNLNISGVKCDNPNCDFKDMTVLADDYKNWLNKPCPKCGSNLLTKADYKSIKCLMKISNLFNRLIPEKNVKQENIAKGSIEMDGTGTIDINFKD